jgi:hypothetical protein
MRERSLKSHLSQIQLEYGNIAVPDLVRYVFKATNLGKKDLGVPHLLRKRYKDASK